MNKHVTRIKQKGLALLGSLKLTISKMNTKKKSGKILRRRKSKRKHHSISGLICKNFTWNKGNFNTLFILAFIMVSLEQGCLGVCCFSL